MIWRNDRAVEVREMLDAGYVRVKKVFFAATEIEPAKRETFLLQACGHDPGLAVEVRSLLRYWQADSNFLDRPIALTYRGRDAPPSPKGISPLVLRRLQKGWERYSLEKCVGAGGSSLVYRATDRRSGRPVAIKLPSSSRSAQLARFRREARLQARVSHPSVLKLHDARSIAGIPFLALKWVGGPSLMATRDTTSLIEKVEIVRKIALGLHAVHRQGIVHLDVKPSNILIEWPKGRDPKPYLADFGIAREVGAGTTHEALLGTPSYVAPERWTTPEVADPRSDVYGLGVTFYQWLTGHTPYPAASTLETMFRISRGEFLLPRDAMPTLPAEIEAILVMCLSVDPAQRYPSAKALAEDLEQFLERRPIVAREVGRMARTWRKTRSLGNEAGMAVAAAVVSLLCRGSRARKPQRPGYGSAVRFGMDSSGWSS